MSGGKTYSKYISSQSESLYFGSELLPHLRLTYFEGASRDAREKSQLSEDFISYKYEDDVFSFVLCDGVQQSIDASHAARQLGLRLVNKLPAVLGEKTSLERFLYEQREHIRRYLLSIPLDEQNPLTPLHRKARREEGAQVKFTCGVIDFLRNKVDVYWAGDVRFIAYGSESKVLFSWEDDNRQFWSSTAAYAMNLNMKSWRLEEISRLSITSDGIRENFKEIKEGEKFLDDTTLANLRYDIGVDDISGLDINIAPKVIDNKILPKTKAILDGRMFSWSNVGAERCRIYYESDGNIEEVVEVDAKHGSSYKIPELWREGYVFIQSLSVNLISSEVSEKLHYIPQPKPQPKPQPEPQPEPQPKPFSRPSTLPYLISGLFVCVVLIITSVFLIPSIIGIVKPTATVGNFAYFSPTISSFVYTPTIFITPTLVVEKPSFTPPATFMGSSLTPTSSPTYTPTSTFTSTPPLTLTFTPTFTATPTPSFTPLPDLSVLTDCQRNEYNKNPDRWLLYQIQQGEILSSYARQYSISVQDLQSVNCYPNDQIKAGEYILLPKQ